jgi:hypothetical protein
LILGTDIYRKEYLEYLLPLVIRFKRTYPDKDVVVITDSLELDATIGDTEYTKQFKEVVDRIIDPRDYDGRR